MRALRFCAIRLWQYLDDENAEDVYRGELLGSGCTSRRWYSICSIHGGGTHDRSCRMCMIGKYVTWWKHQVTSKLYDVSPRTWRWWANLERQEWN